MQSMMLRSFIAIELPAEVQAAIASETASLQKALPKPLVRWVASKNLHLTLKFLGDVSPANLEKLAEALEVESVRYDKFSLSVGGLGAFPTSRRPRVIWVGLEAPALLSVVQRTVEAVSSRMGYPTEDRPFSPHLTIGRVGQDTSPTDLKRICGAIEETKIGSLGMVNVDAIHIFKSDLQPGGSVYTHLYAMPLKS
jgi:RNA 2',3'-cyclic 3'-phosphodiesterase